MYQCNTEVMRARSKAAISSNPATMAKANMRFE